MYREEDFPNFFIHVLWYLFVSVHLSMALNVPYGTQTFSDLFVISLALPVDQHTCRTFWFDLFKVFYKFTLLFYHSSC